MDFQLTDEQLQLQSMVRDFAAREIAPHVHQWDEASQFPLETVKQLGKLGLMGCIFPDEYGGSGYGYIEYVLAIEELSRVDGSVGIIVAAHTSLCTNHIFLAGNEEQRRRYVPRLATGEHIGAWALTEPNSGSDAGSARCAATRKGDRWVLNGTKTFITNGAYADVCVVVAVTGAPAAGSVALSGTQAPAAGSVALSGTGTPATGAASAAYPSAPADKATGTRGLSAFIVERGTPGFRAGKKENKLGLRASDTSELIFEDCEIPAENLLGVEGQGFVDAMRILDGGRISIAALGLGMAAGAYHCALQYSRQRKQFDRPISDFQAIQWKLADMATEIDAARLLTMRAAWLKDHHKKTTLESSMAKLYTSEVAVRVANEAVQIHGGYGFIKDYPAEKFYRDVKLCTIGEGTSEIQRMVIARQLLAE